MKKEHNTSKAWLQIFKMALLLQLTIDVAKHFFGNDYTTNKYLSAIKEVYKVEKPEYVLSPVFAFIKKYTS